MMPKDIEALIALVEQRKWVALAGVLVFVLIRLLKDDTKIPINIPPRLRFLSALALGLVFGVLERKTKDDSITWTQAIIGGLVSGVLAILIQNGVIDSIFKGREPLLPTFLMRPGVPSSPGKAPSLPPPTNTDPPTP